MREAVDAAELGIVVGGGDCGLCGITTWEPFLRHVALKAQASGHPLATTCPRCYAFVAVKQWLTKHPGPGSVPVDIDKAEAGKN